MAVSRVIIAEDDPGMLEWLCDVISQHGADVILARSGVDVLHHINNDARISIAIVDVHIPPPSGLRVVALARLAGFRGPFLLITAFPDEVLRRWVANMDRTALLAKPFTAEELSNAVRLLGGFRPPVEPGPWGDLTPD